MITLQREALSEAVQAIASLAKPNSFHPAASMAFLSVEDGSATIKATDGDNWLSLTVAGDGTTTDTAIQVEAAKLNDLIGKLSGDMVKLDIAGGYLLLSSGKGSKRKLAGVATVYPELPPIDGDAVAVDVDAFRAAVDFCAPNVASPDRPTFNGVRLEAGHAVAYNGAGLTAATIATPFNPVTLRTGTLKLLKWLPSGGNVDVTVSERLIALNWDGGRIASKIGEGAWTFMSKGVDAIIPEHDWTLKAHPSSILSAINAVAVLAADDTGSKSKMIVLRLSRDECFVHTKSAAGSGEEPLDAEWSGDDLEINLSGGRLRQILAGFDADKDVTIGITPLPSEAGGAVKGCVFRQDSKPGFVGMLAQIR